MFNSDPVAFARIEDGNVTRLDIGRRHGEADVTAIQPGRMPPAGTKGATSESVRSSQ